MAVDIDLHWRNVLPHQLTNHPELASWAIALLKQKLPVETIELLPTKVGTIQVVPTRSQPGSQIYQPTLLIVYQGSALLLQVRNLARLNSLSTLANQLLGIDRVQVSGSDGCFANDWDEVNKRWILWSVK